MILQNKDINGQTPLHAAVKAAAKLKPDGNRDGSRKIIEMLVWGTSNNNAGDKTGCTAWDYVDNEREDHAWLQALRDKYQGINKDDFALKPFGYPDKKQAHSYKQSWAIVAEFHHSSESHRAICNHGKVSVYELLYQQIGPYQVLLRTRRLDVSRVVFDGYTFRPIINNGLRTYLVGWVYRTAPWKSSNVKVSLVANN
ncbi:hypothetical protein BDW72DRAFT_11688 [Aspergillus terricola var. indicus]